MSKVKFVSKNDYPVFQMGQACVGMPILITGFPLNSSNIENTFGIINNVGFDLTSRPSGYGIAYGTRIPSDSKLGLRRNTFKGMSGSGVISLIDGKVIGIHGEAGTNSSSSKNLSSKRGLSFAMPLISHDGIKIHEKFFEISKNEYLSKFVLVPSTDDLILVSDYFHSIGDLTSELQILDKLISIYPNDYAHYANKANLLRDLKRFSEALKSWDIAIKMIEESEETHNYFKAPLYTGRALVETELGNYSNAQNDYQKAIEYSPNYFRAYHGLITNLIHDKKSEEAIRMSESFLESLNFSNKDPESLYIIEPYVAALAAVNPKKAINISSIYLESFPKSLTLYIYRYNAYVQLDDKKAALEELRRARVKFPSSPFIINLLARNELNYGKADKAYKLYKLLTKLEPFSANHSAYACYSLWKMGEYKDAINECQLAINKNKGFALSYRYKALALFDIGEFDLAFNAYSNAIEYSNQPEGLDFMNRGEALWYLNKSSDACKDFSFALSNNVKNKIDIKDAKINWEPAYVEYCSS